MEMSTQLYTTASETLSVGGSMNCRANLGVVEKRKLFVPPGEYMATAQLVAWLERSLDLCQQTS